MHSCVGDPRALAVPSAGERLAGQGGILGDLEIEHADTEKVRAAVEGKPEPFFGRDGAGGQFRRKAGVWYNSRAMGSRKIELGATRRAGRLAVAEPR